MSQEFKDVPPPEDVTRRSIITQIGSQLFYLAILGSAGFGMALPAAATSRLACSAGETDESCGIKSPDAGCAPPNEKWEGHNPDESCHSVFVKDPIDEGCNPDPNPPNADIDENCALTPPDEDQSCWNGQIDEACHMTPHYAPDTSKHDKDESCGKTDVDNACGDCDDHHDADDSCGYTIGGTVDKDEDCGHAHYDGKTDTDAACTVKSGAGTESDHNCGVANPTYNYWGGGTSNADQNCMKSLPGGGADPDSNCYRAGSDNTCSLNPGAYSSDPDEDCSATSMDQACGQTGTQGVNPAYDDDESCSLKSSSDEACGYTDGPGYALTESDDNCGSPDPDNNCSAAWDPDDF